MKGVLGFKPSHGATTILIRRGTHEELVKHDPVLAEGEPVLDTTERSIRIGDGVTPWSELPERWGLADVLYFTPGAVVQGPRVEDF